MERATLLSHGELILPEHLPARLRQATQSEKSAEATPASRLEDIERQAILLALRETNYNRTEAAKVLGISRRALTYKLQHMREQGYEVDAR
jgi:DNA-binding NtrC family response regulator